MNRLAPAFCSILLACGSGGAADDGTGADATVGAGSIQFSNLRIEEISGDRAVMRFDTSVPTSCVAEFGVASTNLDRSATDPDMAPGELALDHDVPLEDLAPDTLYYVRARATDAMDVTERSSILMFTTTTNVDPTASMTNYARLSEGTTVMQVSSNWASGGNASSFGINNALDGSMSTEWSSNGDGDNAFVVIDLGQNRSLTYFAFRSRMMTDGTSITKKVRVLVDGTQTVLGPFETPDHTVRYVFPLTPAVTGRQLRVESVETTGGNTGAKEIQFY